MDEIDELLDLLILCFIWGFVIVVILFGEVLYDEFEYLMYICILCFICCVVEFEDVLVELEDEGDIDGCIVYFDNFKWMFYIMDLGLVLMNFMLFDKVDNKFKLKDVCD